MSEISIKECFEDGVPWYGFDSLIPKKELALRTIGAQEACLAAHARLYEAAAENQAVVFDDEHEPQTGKAKFISLPNKYGEPSYFRWDKNHPATDIGIRGINPAYEQVANPTTIIHADAKAATDLQQQGALPEVVEAVDAVGILNRFVTTHIARPLLLQLAAEYGEPPYSYIEKFFPRQRRARTLTRAILYHLSVEQDARPTGSDGAPLLIKEHFDQSSYTIDSTQSAPGLEYRVGDEWQTAKAGIVCFRGRADDYLREKTKPTLHRVRLLEQVINTAPASFVSANVGRIAMPTFVSPSDESVRAVQPSSLETHPQTLQLNPRSARTTKHLPTSHTDLPLQHAALFY